MLKFALPDARVRIVPPHREARSAAQRNSGISRSAISRMLVF